MSALADRQPIAAETEVRRELLLPSAPSVAQQLQENQALDRQARWRDFQRLQDRVAGALANYQEHVRFLGLEAEVLARLPGDGSRLLGYIADLAHGLYTLETLILPQSSAIPHKAAPLPANIVRGIRL